MPQGLACGKGQARTRAKPPPAPGSRRVSLPGSIPRALPTPAGPAAPRDPGPTSWDDKEGPPEEEIYLVCEPLSPQSSPEAQGSGSRPCPIPPSLPWPCPVPPSLPRPRDPAPVLLWGRIPGEAPWMGGRDSNPPPQLLSPLPSAPQDPGMLEQAWYAGSCDRHVAESVLQGVNKDSAFMVRQSSGQGWNQPFTLAVLYKGHVYNIPIRYVENSRQYALGKDGKSREERFDSVAGIIQHHREHPLVLIEGSSASRAHTCLLFPVKP
ncbi:cytochrome c oxidase assembly factor 7 [Platysternon megacephalum]|uniref:Cytochrome c oxidase assembly factor 7 n=1 Tax=Platysternon megacephalum TaxID=55544 RepID=A0A4D9DJV0_9SAUR|nr:cytochrome c oxidase assembly factor 7 [Platysternon megacephalum]